MQGPDPEQYTPPLSRMDHVWRTLLCLVISGVSWFEIAGLQFREHRALFWLDLGLGLVSLVLMFYRRRWPFGVALLVTAFGLASTSSAGPGALVLVSLASTRRLPKIIVVGSLGIVVGQLFTYYQPSPSNDPPWLNFTFIVAATVAMIAIGMYVGSRRELLWTLRDRANRAESEQELRVASARSTERERIAREMHDVLAHRISLVTMHAGALAYRTDLTAEQVHETAELIQVKSHEALADLRQVLGMLRGEHGQSRPQPTWRDLPELVEEARASGMDVEFSDRLPADPAAPEQAGRTCYRIVQEALTNARKHGGGLVRVQLQGSPQDGIEVVVRNGKMLGRAGALATPGAGLGLVGLRERAELSGGTLTVRESQDAFSLRGWLPWPT